MIPIEVKIIKYLKGSTFLKQSIIIVMILILAISIVAPDLVSAEVFNYLIGFYFVLIIFFLILKKRRVTGFIQFYEDQVKVIENGNEMLIVLSDSSITVSIKFVSFKGMYFGRSFVTQDGSKNVLNLVMNGLEHNYNFLIEDRSDFLKIESILRENYKNHKNVELSKNIFAP